MRAALRVILWVIALPAALAAHPSAEERLESLARRADGGVCDAPASLRRAAILTEQHDWLAALAELERADACDPSSPAAELARAELHLLAGEPGPARQSADRYLARSPDAPRGLLARARAWSQLGLLAESVNDYDRALALLPQPQPDHYLERARTQVAAGQTKLAAAGLGAGILRLGSVPALVELAVDLEVSAGHHPQALALIDQVSPQQRASPAWMMRRAEILELAGNRSAASDICRQALRQLAHRRKSQPRCTGLDCPTALARRAQHCAALAAEQKDSL